MQEKKASKRGLPQTLSAIFKKTYAFVFRNILLSPDWVLNATARVGHYDIQCESAELIKDIFKNIMFRKKIEGFMNIKLYRKKRFVRAQTPKQRYKHSQTSQKKYQTPPTAYQNRSQAKKKVEVQESIYNGVNQEVFQKVKSLTKTLVRLRKQRQKHQKQAKKSIFYQIDNLQTELNHFKNSKSIIVSRHLNTSVTTLKQSRANGDVKKIFIEKLSIYI